MAGHLLKPGSVFAFLAAHRREKGGLWVAGHCGRGFHLTRSITPTRNAVFGVACRDCPLRARCTTSQSGRTIRLHEHETLLRAARSQAETPQFQAVYRGDRPMVERSIAWLVRDNRRVRYRGVTKYDQWLHHRAEAINLRRQQPSASIATTEPGPSRPGETRSAGPLTARTRHLTTAQQSGNLDHDGEGDLVSTHGSDLLPHRRP